MDTDLGGLIRERRKAMLMSLSALSQNMGGTPGASFLHRIEVGHVSPTREVSVRLSRALSLPRDIVLNAAGHTSDGQIEAAMEKLRDLVGEAAPSLVHIPVYDPADVTNPTGEMRPRVLRVKEEVRIVDLSGEENAPFIGEVMYSPTRKVREGAGVVVEIDGRASAWTWHEAGRTSWIENGLGKKSQGFKVQGVIARVTRTVEIE